MEQEYSNNLKTEIQKEMQQLGEAIAVHFDGRDPRIALETLHGVYRALIAMAIGEWAADKLDRAVREIGSEGQRRKLN